MNPAAAKARNKTNKQTQKLVVSFISSWEIIVLFSGDKFGI
jgi:PIN domain nuclease of toxin-antitoxin system